MQDPTHWKTKILWSLALQHEEHRLVEEDDLTRRVTWEIILSTSCIDGWPSRMCHWKEETHSSTFAWGYGCVCGKAYTISLVGPWRGTFLVQESFTQKNEEWNLENTQLSLQNFVIETKF